jgi:hypothetical protein
MAMGSEHVGQKWVAFAVLLALVVLLIPETWRAYVVVGTAICGVWLIVLFVPKLRARVLALLGRRKLPVSSVERRERSVTDEGVTHTDWEEIRRGTDVAIHPPTASASAGAPPPGAQPSSTFEDTRIGRAKNLEVDSTAEHVFRRSEVREMEDSKIKHKPGGGRTIDDDAEEAEEAQEPETASDHDPDADEASTPDPHNPREA